MSEENEIHSCRRLLHEIGELCEEASLTGSLSGGSRRTAQRYNAILNRLTEVGSLPKGLFSPIPEDSEYGEIGVEARMLASYFPSEKDKHKQSDSGDRGILMRLAPFVGKDELALLIRDQASKGMGLDINTLTSIAPFLGQDILGQLLREHLSKDKSAPEPPHPEAKPAAPVHPEPPAKPDYRLEPLASQKESVEDLLNLLKSPYLSDEERNNAVERLRAAR